MNTTRPSSERPGTVRRSALLALAATAGYAAVSQYVLWLNDPVNAGAGFWPGAGITLAALLVIPRRHWWMVVCGVLLAEIGGDTARGYPFAGSVLWGLANVVEPAVGATLIHRFSSARGRLVPVRNVLVFVLCGAVLAPIVGGAVGSFGAVLEFGSAWSEVWPKWVAGDGLGVLVVAPALLAWGEQRSTQRGPVESAAVLLLLCGTSALAFQNWGHALDAVLPYLVLPGMVWAGIRFGVRGAAVAGLVVAQAANLGTGLGYGPFSLAPATDDYAITLLQVFLAVTVTTTLILGALSADLTDRHEASRLLTHQATHDPLTGLPNRLELQERLDRAVSRPRPGCSTAVMFLDLDGFKVVNDSFGHAWGDALLVEIATRLRDTARPRDLVARIGGDEFVVVAYDLASGDDALPMARRLLHAVGEPVTHEGRTLVVSASLGIALTDGIRSAGEVLRNADRAMYRAKGQAGVGIDSSGGAPGARAGAGVPSRALLADADHALYAAKRAGGGRAVLWQPGHDVEERAQDELLGELMEALAGGALTLAYQPIVDIATLRVCGLEALARWQHPVRGSVPPPVLVACAERGGIMRSLTRWALRAALEGAASWPEAHGGQPLKVAVNISGAQLADGLVVEDVRAALAASGISPARVVLEVAETSRVVDLGQAQRTLTALAGLGVGLALDDFGAGLSSLTHVSTLPFDILKIDRSLVAAASVGDKRALACVTAVCALAAGLEVDVVAEGVEDRTFLSTLAQVGCGCAQGFALARPLTPAQLGAAFAAAGPRGWLLDGAPVPRGEGA
ncbi:MAG: hypothetical protein JWN88_1998 [Frankiales bacterium]|nr:hypothetical protein [Frankiales bacterium]